MSEENKAIHRSIWEEIWNQGNLDLADEIYDSSHISHGQGIDLPSGPEGLKTLISTSSIYCSVVKNLKWDSL